MGFAENVLNKVRGTLPFKPASVDSFGNWAIEAGDIIAVENDGVTEHIPIFSSDMNWNGSAQTTMSCTGNQKREIQDKKTRKEFTTSSGLSAYTDKKMDELEDSFGVELDGIRAGMNAYVKRVQKKDADGNPVFDENGNPVWEDWSASAEVFTRVDDVKAIIGAYVVVDPDTGKSQSLAAVLADIIQLKGRVDVSGILSIDNGAITSSGPIYAPNQTISGGELKAQDLYASRDFYYQDKKYTPQQITSTSGAVLALGYA